MSETPGHFTRKAIKIAIEEVRKVIRSVSIRMIKKPENTEIGLKNWSMSKQLIIMDKKTEDTMTIDKVRCEAKNFEKYMWLRLTGNENSVLRKPISLEYEIIK